MGYSNHVLEHIYSYISPHRSGPHITTAKMVKYARPCTIYTSMIRRHSMYSSTYSAVDTLYVLCTSNFEVKAENPNAQPHIIYLAWQNAIGLGERIKSNTYSFCHSFSTGAITVQYVFKRTPSVCHTTSFNP